MMLSIDKSKHIVFQFAVDFAIEMQTKLKQTTFDARTTTYDESIVRFVSRDVWEIMKANLLAVVIKWNFVYLI